MVHIFPKSSDPKVNLIARLEFELAHFRVAVQRFSHFTTRTSPLIPEKISVHIDIIFVQWFPMWPFLTTTLIHSMPKKKKTKKKKNLDLSF